MRTLAGCRVLVNHSHLICYGLNCCLPCLDHMRNLWHMKRKRFIASWSLLGVKRIMILYTTFALFSYSEVFSYVSCRPGSYLSLWKQHDWWKIERYKVMYIMLQIVKVKRINYYLKGVIFILHQTTRLSLWKQHDSWKIVANS